MKFHSLVILLGLCMCSSIIAQDIDSISLNVKRHQDRVEVLVNGELFTAYRFEATLEKPVLFPVHAPDGTIVTRGYPLSPRGKERVDHPHHVGLWFNFGDVNGYDFWNNSSMIPDERKGAYGRIIHRSIDQAETMGALGVLKVKMDWMAPDNEQAEKLIEESTAYIFRAEKGVWMVDRITSLTAATDSVIFTDNKEGMLAIRVDRAFEHPSNSPVILTDASGKATTEAVQDKQKLTGWYENSEGDEGLAVWGKNARWVKLTGTKGESTCSMIMMDHPLNINYPSCWHARGYGLFAINNLGRQVYNRELEKFQLILEKGETLTFRHRFVLVSSNISLQEVEAIHMNFISE
jgi:hypothetical protein